MITRLLWLALIFGICRSIPIPVYGNHIITVYQVQPYTINDFAYYFFNSAILVVLCKGYDLFSNTILSKMALYLAIGKLIDEMVYPFGYGFIEFIWDTVVIIWAITKWSIKSNTAWYLR